MTIKRIVAKADPSDDDYWCKAAAGCFFMARDTGRILFCHRAKGVEAPNTWAAWGGGMERGESPVAAMKREVQEETGLDPSSIEEFHPLYTHADPESGFHYHSFLAMVPTEFRPVMPADECQGFRWVDTRTDPPPGELHPGVAFMFERTQAIQTMMQHLKRNDVKMRMSRVVARLSETAGPAVFDDAMVSQIQQKILPALNSIVKIPDAKYMVSWFPADLPRRGMEKQADVINDAWHVWSEIASLVEAVAGKKSPAIRVAMLKNYMKKTEKEMRPEYFKLYRDAPNLMKNALVWTKKAFAINNPQVFSPEARETVTKFMTSPAFLFLKSNWPVIAAQVTKEYSAILKQHKFLEVKKGLGYAQLAGPFKAYMQKLGFTLEPFPKDNDYGFKDGGIRAVKDKVRLSLLKSRDPNWALAYLWAEYQLLKDNYWYNNARTGVDDGTEVIRAGDVLENKIEKELEEVQKMQEAYAKREREGVEVKFGPHTQKLLPAKLAEIIQKLKAGKTYSIEPSGFGTAYLFTTRKVADATPADADISKRVGAPVFYVTQDRD